MMAPRKIWARGDADHQFAVVEYTWFKGAWRYTYLRSWHARFDVALENAMIANLTHGDLGVQKAIVRCAPFYLRASLYEIPWRVKQEP